MLYSLITKDTGKVRMQSDSNGLMQLYQLLFKTISDGSLTEEPEVIRSLFLLLLAQRFFLLICRSCSLSTLFSIKFSSNSVRKLKKLRNLDSSFSQNLVGRRAPGLKGNDKNLLKYCESEDFFLVSTFDGVTSIDHSTLPN